MPPNYPAIQFKHLTKEDVEQMAEHRHFVYRKAAKALSTELDIAGYIEACSQMQLTLNDWLGLKGDSFYEKFGLPDLIKEALKLEARYINEQIRKKREEEMTDLKLQANEPNRNLSGRQSIGHLDRIFK